MKKTIALLAVTLCTLVAFTGCGEKKSYHSLSSQGAIKKINKDKK